MKTKNIIVIENLCAGPKSIEVNEFSRKTVIEAISKLMDIPEESINCDSSCMSEGMFSVKPVPRGLKDEVFSIGFSDLVLKVLYVHHFE